MSILVSPEPLSCHVHTGPFDPAMKRQCDLHAKELNKRRLHQVRLVILFFIL
jgi:hypothetical protein